MVDAVDYRRGKVHSAMMMRDGSKFRQAADFPRVFPSDLSQKLNHASRDDMNSALDLIDEFDLLSLMAVRRFGGHRSVCMPGC